MTDFRDFDPEDAWDDGDPIEDKVEILERVVIALRALREVPPDRREDALRLVYKLWVLREDLERRIEAVRAALEGMR